MNVTKVILIITSTIVIAACTASKKSTTSTSTTATPATTIAPTPTVAAVTTASSTAASSGPANPFGYRAPGVNEPTTNELNSLLAKYSNLKDASLEKLKQGYVLYTQTACIQCHKAFSIYEHNEADWVGIINRMALKARMNHIDKDAVFNYVIAMKTAQPK